MISRREVTCMKTVGTILIVAILTIVPLSGCLSVDNTFISKSTQEEQVAIDHLFVGNNHISKEYNRVNNWSIQVVDPVGTYPSIALDSNDLPHILYYNDSGNELLYARYDGNEWQREIVESGDYYDNTTSLVLDSNDHPHIAYVSWAVGGWPAHGLKYAYHDGNAWNITYLEEMVDFASLALDSKERPHISCSKGGEWPGYWLKHIYWNGSQWHNETVDQDGWVRWNSIAVDSNDRIHISYKKFITSRSGHLKYAYFNGDSWKNETLDDQGNAGSYNSIALNSSGLPHIAYRDSTYSGVHLKQSNLSFTYFDGDSWNKEIVDSDYYVGLYNSLFIDTLDRPHISYIESQPNDALLYAFWNGVAWQNETVESGGWFSYSSMALSPSGQKHICYRSGDGLKYAYSNITISEDEPPVSTVDVISPYRRKSIPFNINVTAEDNISSVIRVQLWYRFSSDNSSWAEWKLLGSDVTSPWSFIFTAPNSSGYYEFYSIAMDSKGNREGSRREGYRVPIRCGSTGFMAISSSPQLLDQR